MLHDSFPIVWSDFHFLRPHFLWLLIPMGIIVLLGWLSLRQNVRWKNAISPHLRPFIIKKGAETTRFWMNIALGVMLGLGVVALSGPTWKKIQIPGQQLETPLVILLDLSQSMLADDIQPNRLERAKFKIKDLLEHKPGARVALIGFAGTAHTIVPLTKDYGIILSHLEGLKPSMMPFPGSSLEAAFLNLDSVLYVTRAPGTILIFSDDFTNDNFNLIRTYTENSANKVIVLPINTQTGSEVPSLNGQGSMKDKKGNPVFSSLNSQVLNKLDALENVEVHSLTLDDSDVEKISETIRANLEFTEQPKEKQDDWRDAGGLFLIPAAILLLLWFRKGWVLYGIFPLIMVSCHQNSRFADLWFTRDYQAQKLSNEGDFEAAAKLYTDPMRKGVAYFKAGNFEDAIKSFNQDTTAMGTYNLGLAYLQNGDTLSAKMAFGIAVEKDPTMEQAQTNLQQLGHLSGGENEVNPEDVKEAGEKGEAQNQQNTSSEDLSGGGQEATKEDMKKQRLEETVATNVRKGKELEEVPDDVGATEQQQSSQVLMRKVDDDPSLFLKRKFAYQVKKYKLKSKSDGIEW